MKMRKRIESATRPWPRRVTAKICPLRRAKSLSLPTRLGPLIAVVGGLALLGPSAASACTTPVYQYAMYNWAPAPFFVFYFHHGDPPQEDEEVNGLIAKLAETGPAPANLLLQKVDLSQGQLDGLPGPVKEAWQEHVGKESGTPRPAHVIFTSWYEKLFAGRLDTETVQAMVDSPVRKQIGELLNDGCATVMVFVPGSEAAQNKEAEQVAKQLISQAAAGEIPVEAAYADPALSQWMPPAEGDADSQAYEDAVREASKLQIGWIKIDPADQAEAWFLRTLMKIEPDLHEYAEQPMIFFAYGRGRAMPPYVGEGITPDNLTGEVQFLAGACSCMVRDMNPGADLLMRWDWEATADAMAAREDPYYSGQFAYQEFSPDETGNMVASVTPSAEGEAASADAGSEPGLDDATSARRQENQELESVETAGVEKATEQRPDTSGADRAPQASAETFTAAEEKPPGGEGPSFASRQMWMFGIGFVVVAVAVLVGGLVLIWKRA